MTFHSHRWTTSGKGWQLWIGESSGARWLGWHGGRIGAKGEKFDCNSHT